MSLLEQFKNKNVCLISHNDLDGIGSVIIYKYYIEPVVKMSQLHICSYDDISDMESNADILFKNFDIICFTDITPTKDLYFKCKQMGIEVKIFDHHQSAYTSLMNTITTEYYYSIDKCGAEIFFEEVTKNRRTLKCAYQMVQYISTYDLWKENSALWKEGKALHNILWGSINWNAVNAIDKYNKFITNQLEKLYKNKNFYFTSYEQRLATHAEAKEHEFYIKAKNSISLRVDNEGNNYGYFECPSKISLICNKLLKEFPQLNYIVGHSTFNDSAISFDPSISLRSLGEVDVSIIASLYNGGGHHNAAGILFNNYDDFLNFKQGKMHLI